MAPISLMVSLEVVKQI